MIKSASLHFDQSTWNIINRSIRSAHLIVLSITIIISINFQLKVIQFPFQFDYAEAPIVDHAVRLAAGENIYRADISNPPYTITNYPPIYPGLLAFNFMVFGTSAPFLFGRLVSSLAAWLSAIILGLIIFEIEKDIQIAFLTGATFISLPFVTNWSPLLRVDMLALAFSLAGLLLIIRIPITNARLLFSALLMVCAIFTRQTYGFAAPCAVFVWLISQKNYRKVVVYSAIIGFLSALFFILLNYFTQGGFFYNIVTSNVNEFIFKQMLDGYKLFFIFNPVPVVASVFLIIILRGKNRFWFILSPYLICAVISGLTIGKVGAAENYFLELCAASALAVGAMVAWSKVYLSRQVLIVIFNVVLVVSAILMAKNLVINFSAKLISMQASIVEKEKLETFIKKTPGEILADDAMGMLVLQNRPIIIQPFETTQLVQSGKWNNSGFIKNVEDQRFSAILLSVSPGNNVIWAPEMLATITKYYHSSQVIDGSAIYLPNKETQ